ncbi:hypothetical protein G5I_03291 [Acromyrmex echinatior]|uniref:Uncharacterized protein n=1 Tax=Acromyrmex echinatior TaxID=103372 RepID=F4WCL5_ACREC|nr:hypothetical protein G5I_03291 [Acromyrmex echinatior]
MRSFLVLADPPIKPSRKVFPMHAPTLCATEKTGTGGTTTSFNAAITRRLIAVSPVRRHNYVVIGYKYRADKFLRHNEEAMPQQGRDEQKSKRPFPQWPLTLHDCVRPSQSRLVELVRAQAPPPLSYRNIGQVTTLEMAPPSFSAGQLIINMREI